MLLDMFLISESYSMMQLSEVETNDNCRYDSDCLFLPSSSGSSFQTASFNTNAYFSCLIKVPGA